MSEEYTKNANKRINPSLLDQQLRAASFGDDYVGIDWIGFKDVQTVTFRMMDPSTEYGHTAGDLIYKSSRSLSSGEQTELDNVLTNHDYTQFSDEQLSMIKDKTELTAVTTGYESWDTLNDNEKDTVIKQALRLMLRALGGYHDPEEE